MKNIFIKFSTLFISLIVFASCGVEAPIPGVVTSEDQVKGNIQSPIVITEYSDFQCPACGYYEEIIINAWEDIQNDVVFVYRNFPLQTIHPYALTAAKYAEAAGMQGKYWGMHGMLFENQEAWSKSGTAKDDFDSYAQALGLDMDQFEKDLASSKVQQKIRSDIASANKEKLNSTPTFFINEDKVQFRDAQELVALVNQYKSN